MADAEKRQLLIEAMKHPRRGAAGHEITFWIYALCYACVRVRQYCCRATKLHADSSTSHRAQSSNTENVISVMVGSQVSFSSSVVNPAGYYRSTCPPIIP